MIPTKVMDGDLSLGRNMSVGGNVTSQGNSHIKGNLRVDGWVKANNVDVANKGLFPSSAELRKAYPSPKPGWWAIVGNTVPGEVVAESNGQWQLTGATGGEPDPFLAAEETNDILSVPKGKINRLTKAGVTIYPATNTDAVEEPHTKRVLTDLINNINISHLYPNDGVNRGNQYDLPSAISRIPKELNKIGFTCTFLSYDTGVIETWRRYGSEPNNPESWICENRTIPEPILYSDLVALCKAGKLIPQRRYRICDYDTFVSQENIRVAGNHFDIIVEALTNSTLSEDAYACASDRDTGGYFQYTDFSRWRLKYTIDNSRYDWGDTVNGKGIIYRLIDEFNNDVCYDFKNIIFTLKANFQYNGDTIYRDESYDTMFEGTKYYGYHSGSRTAYVTDERITYFTKIYSEPGDESYQRMYEIPSPLNGDYFTFSKTQYSFSDGSTIVYVSPNQAPPTRARNNKIINTGSRRLPIVVLYGDPSYMHENFIHPTSYVTDIVGIYLNTPSFFTIKNGKFIDFSVKSMCVEITGSCYCGKGVEYLKKGSMKLFSFPNYIDKRHLLTSLSGNSIEVRNGTGNNIEDSKDIVVDGSNNTVEKSSEKITITGDNNKVGVNCRNLKINGDKNIFAGDNDSIIMDNTGSAYPVDYARRAVNNYFSVGVETLKLVATKQAALSNLIVLPFTNNTLRTVLVGGNERACKFIGMNDSGQLTVVNPIK